MSHATRHHGVTSHSEQSRCRWWWPTPFRNTAARMKCEGSGDVSTTRAASPRSADRRSGCGTSRWRTIPLFGLRAGIRTHIQSVARTRIGVPDQANVERKRRLNQGRVAEALFNAGRCADCTGYGSPYGVPPVRESRPAGCSAGTPIPLKLLCSSLVPMVNARRSGTTAISS